MNDGTSTNDEGLNASDLARQGVAEQQLSEMRRLVSRALDGELSASAVATIEQILQQQPEWIEHYTSMIANDTLIEHACGKSVLEPEPAPKRADQLLQSDEFETTTSKAEVSKAPIPPEESLSKTHDAMPLRVKPRGWPALKRWTPYAITACLLVATGLWLINRPVAHLVASEDAEWADGVSLEVGSSVGRDWFELERGEVKLAFRSGAMASIQGPARFRAATSNRAEVDHGMLTARVPELAHGFTVETPQATIVDLGTSFRVQAMANGMSRVHVTDGRVRFEKNGESGAMEVLAGEIATIAADRASIEVETSNLLATSDTVVYQSEHPTSLGYNAFDHDNQIYVFLEGHNLLLAEDLRVNLSKPGRHTRFDATQGTIAKGRTISSYLVHCAPVQRRHIVEGRMSFNGKIVGVIGASDSLNATNSLLGASWTLQCRHAERGIESTPDFNSDVVTISDDRRTLSLILRTESIDQVRVLVADE